MPSEETKDDIKSHGSQFSQVKVYPPSNSGKFFDHIPPELWYFIGTFFKNPVTKLGSINNNFFEMFHSKFSLKHFVSRNFYIPEFESVKENEPELAGILNLSWSRHDPFAFFGALMEDISSGKKPYKVLSRPLLILLSRTFNELNMEHQQCFKTYVETKFKCSFEIHLANICVKEGHYDLAFGFLNDYPEDLVKLFSKVNDGEKMTKFFKSNPHLAVQYERALISTEIAELNAINADIFKWDDALASFYWIRDCIIYDAPEYFFIGLFDFKPSLLKCIIDTLLEKFGDMPSESEFPRIHIQMRRLLDVHVRPFLDEAAYEVYKLIIAIRFGPEDFHQLDHLNFNEKGIILIAKMALFGNKLSLFLEIFDKHNTYYVSYGRWYKIMDSLVNMMRYNDFSLQKNNFKLIYQLIASSSSSIHFTTADYLYSLAKLYAIEGLKWERNQVIFQFVALKDLVTLGFPQKIHVQLQTRDETSWFMQDLFSCMKVFNEDTISSLLDDYEKCPNSRRLHYVSPALPDLLELISKSPNLIEKFIKADIKFNVSYYLDLPNFGNLIKIVGIITFDPKSIPQLKNKEHLRLIELLRKKTVAKYFLRVDTLTQMTECDYFRWRTVFSYWIKDSDQKERIREISSPAIIKMLKLEFPHIFATLNGMEAVKKNSLSSGSYWI